MSDNNKDNKESVASPPRTDASPFKIGLPPLHPMGTATTTTTSGIQITIPGLPTSCAMETEGGERGGGGTPVSTSKPNTPITPGVKPAIGVPVPVITSVQSTQNRSPVATKCAPSVTSFHSQFSVSNEVDEDYDS